MKSLTISIIKDSTLADNLGKKGTSSDITLYNRKTDNTIFTFIVPHSYPEKVSSLIQSIGIADAHILTIDQIDQTLGETLLILAATEKKPVYMIINNPVIDEGQLDAILKQTGIDPIRTTADDILAELEQIQPNTTETPTEIHIDHSFQVKSVGTVALGFLKKGNIKPYDKLTALPSKKEVLIKSIQMQSKNVESAESPARVGLSLKGIEVDDLDRGTILTDKPEEPKTTYTLKIEKCPFYRKEIRPDTKLHLAQDLLFREVTIKEATNETITIESPRPLSLKENTILLIDNSEKIQRLAAKAVIQ